MRGTRRRGRGCPPRRPPRGRVAPARAALLDHASRNGPTNKISAVSATTQRGGLSRIDSPHRHATTSAYLSSMARAKAKNGRDPLLAAICHDLRAPLAAGAMGANFVLQTTPESSTRQKRILEAMLRSCTQMERLIRNFADLSEIEGNGVALRLGVHDVGEMLELAAEAAADSAHARHVTIEID